MIGIIASRKDLAAKSMEKFFTRHVDWIDEDIIHAKGIDALGYDFVVMASRHKAKSGKPTLTVHPNGNFGDAEYGGAPKTLQATAPQLMRNIYLELKECGLDYDVSLEATHHGPTGFETPLVWAEIGSTEEQWADKEAAEFLVRCMEKGIERNDTVETVIGFGGGHYAPKFSVMEMDIAFGHMCPKYACDMLDKGLIEQMVEKSGEVDYAVLDEKGLKGRHKTLIKTVLDDLGVEH